MQDYYEGIDKAYTMESLLEIKSDLRSRVNTLKKQLHSEEIIKSEWILKDQLEEIEPTLRNKSINELDTALTKSLSILKEIEEELQSNNTVPSSLSSSSSSKS